MRSAASSSRRAFARLAAVGCVLALATSAAAQPAVTSEQDHRNMLDQLGLAGVRPSPSGAENAPNPPNYEEAKANPWVWPELMTLANGRKVTTAEQWWKQRRPEIVELFEREVVGREPARTPAVTWHVEAIERETVARRPVIAQRLVGHVDNSAYPAISVDISMMLILPADATRPVPVLVMFNTRPVFPNPAQPTPAEQARISAALKRLLAEREPELGPLFARLPAYDVVPGAPARPQPPDERIRDLVADGWGVALLDPSSIQADNGAGLRRGIIGLVNKGQPRKPEDWGALRAWTWGASRALDYLETIPAVDAKRVGIEGVSRYGKAAAVTMAFEQRFALGLIASSASAGAKPFRRYFGQPVESLTSPAEYHWMAGNFLKYGAAGRDASDIPVDSHQLIALFAPRLAFISHGVPEAGDGPWMDQQGAYMATVAAGPAYRLLGTGDLGVAEDYRTARKPPVNTGLVAGRLAWRQHDGGHTDAPNIKAFVQWADRFIGHTADPPQ